MHDTLNILELSFAIDLLNRMEQVFCNKPGTTLVDLFSLSSPLEETHYLGKSYF
jgi:hypothetical protein